MTVSLSKLRHSKRSVPLLSVLKTEMFENTFHQEMFHYISRVYVDEPLFLVLLNRYLNRHN